MRDTACIITARSGMEESAYCVVSVQRHQILPYAAFMLHQTSSVDLFGFCLV